MPIHYPPEIDPDSFRDALVVDSAGRQRRLRRERKALRAQRSADASAVQRNRVSRQRCGVEELLLEVGGRRSTSFSPDRARDDQKIDSWTRAHPTIASGGGERINFLPGDPSDATLGAGGETCKIVYRLKKPGRVRRAWLELFRFGDPNPLMRVELRYKSRRQRLEPVDANGPVRLQGADLMWDGRLAAVEARVGGQVIDVGSSPYKLKLSVEPKKGVQLDLGEAWTYFDVLVDAIALEWGDDAVIPTNRGDVDARFQADVRNCEVAMVQDLQHHAVDGHGKIDANDHTLALDSNLFSTDLDGQSGTDTPFRLYREMWGEGPLLPIFAEVALRKSDGAVVAGPAAPWALGAAEFIWDWEDSPGTKVADWAGAAPQRTRDYLDAALDYLVEVEAEAGAAPADANNCHVHHGGKRGHGAPAVFPAQNPVNYTAATAALIPQEFPFAVDPCAARRWAASSRARTAGVERGKTGAMFQPARIAGDRYRVSVYLRTPDFPHDEDGASLRGSPIPHASTGVYEVQRKVKARIYQADATVDTVNDGQLRAIFAEARVALDLGAATPVNAGQWETAFRVGLSKYLDMMPMVKPWLGVMLEVNQAGPNCMELEDFGNGAARVQALAGSGLWEVTLTTAGLKPGDPVEHGPSGTRGYVIHAVDAGGGSWRAYLSHALGQHLAAGQNLTLVRGNANLPVTASRRMDAPPDQGQVRALLDPLCDYSLRQQSYSQVSKGVSTRVMKRYANNVHPGEEAVFMFLFKQMGRHAGEPRAGGTNSSIATETRAFAYLQNDGPGVGLKAFDLVAAHELGHALFLPHAPQEADAKGQVHIEVPGAELDNCIMNYDPSSGHFCGMCMLRLMGWSARGQAEAAANADARLVELANTDTGNKREFEMQTLTASIPCTPPRTVRAMHNSTNLNLPARGTANGADSDDLTANPPLVLLTDSANVGAPLADPQREAVRGPLRLEATARMPDGSKFAWKVERVADDDAQVIAASANALPSLHVSGVDNEVAEIESDATGSFHLKASVDVNGGNAFDDEAGFLCVNLVLVKAERIESNHAFVKRPGGCRLNAGDVEISSATRAGRPEAVALETKIRLIGGGADGRRGLDKVFGGWINNVRSDDTRAEYVATDGSGRQAKAQTLALHRDAGGAASARMNPLPSNAHPVVDKHAHDASMAGWVARRAVLSQAVPSVHTPLGDATVLKQKPIGGHCKIANQDGPAQGWDVNPPNDGTLEIRRIWLHTHFTAYLCLWTESAQTLLGVLEELPWQIDGDYEVNAAGPTRTRARVRISRPVAKTKHATLVAALDTGLEWCPPTSLGDHEPRFFPAGEEPHTHLGFKWDNTNTR